MDLILASTSPIRRTLLVSAGVEFEVMAPEVDEDQVKQGHAGSDAQLAVDLASAKGLAVSAQRSDRLVIGSDSVLSVDGLRFSKPADRDQAAEHLQFFSGKVMRLTSAVALVRGGNVEWTQAEAAELQVRSLSDRFIARYLDGEWPAVGYCVGVFRLEGLGVQLFNKIAGDHFTILGLPLLPLLGALRERGVIPS